MEANANGEQMRSLWNRSKLLEDAMRSLLMKIYNNVIFVFETTTVTFGSYGWSIVVGLLGCARLAILDLVYAICSM